jgi:hypothetical protein
MNLPQTALLSLQAPFPIPFLEDGFIWYPCFDENGFLLNDQLPKVKECIHECALKCVEYLKEYVFTKYPPDRVYFFGFGQGGTIALEMSKWIQSAGIISISGWPCCKLIPLDTHQPALITYGSFEEKEFKDRMRHCSFASFYKVTDKNESEMPKTRDEIKRIMEFIGPRLRLRNLELERQCIQINE